MCIFTIECPLLMKLVLWKEKPIANNKNIRLNNVNPNGENVVANNLKGANFCCFWKNVKIELKNNHHMLFFLWDIIIIGNINSSFC